MHTTKGGGAKPRQPTHDGSEVGRTRQTIGKCGFSRRVRPTAAVYLGQVPECPICRRSNDGRFRVFVPPHSESFDSVDRARRAAQTWGREKGAPPPVILPVLEAARPRAEARVASVGATTRARRAHRARARPQPGGARRRRRPFAGGTAASIYLGARPLARSPHSSSLASRGEGAAKVTHTSPGTKSLPATIAPATARPATHPVRVVPAAHRARSKTVAHAPRLGTKGSAPRSHPAAGTVSHGELIANPATTGLPRRRRRRPSLPRAPPKRRWRRAPPQPARLHRSRSPSPRNRRPPRIHRTARGRRPPHRPTPHRPTPHRPTPHRPTPHRPTPHRPTPHRPTPHRPTPHRPTPHRRTRPRRTRRRRRRHWPGRSRKRRNDLRVPCRRFDGLSWWLVRRATERATERAAGRAAGIAFGAAFRTAHEAPADARYRQSESAGERRRPRERSRAPRRTWTR